MKIFCCQGKDKLGNPFLRTVEAETEEEARLGLEKEGLSVVSVEYDHDASSVRTQHEQGNFREDKRKGIPFGEFLSYAMPIAACVIAVSAVPLVKDYLKPAVPPRSAREIVENYYELERDKNFEAQYKLLSKRMQERFGATREYIKKKKVGLAAKMSRAGKAGGLAKLAGFNETTPAGGRTIISVRVLEPTGMREVEFVLGGYRRRWKIDYIRDPERMQTLLAKLAATETPSDERREIVRIKTETGYTDLDIQALLKKYLQRQKAAQARKVIKSEVIYSSG